MLLGTPLCHLMEKLQRQSGKRFGDFLFSVLINFLLLFPENYQHVQCWNLTTTTSFP